MAFPDSPQLHEVLILGAGPSGLALGYELKRRGIPFLIVERGETVAHSWRHMPTHLKLVSPWKANRLPGSPVDARPANAEISRADYAAWLAAYACQHALPIRTGVEVQEVTRTPDGLFCAQTNAGEFNARLLVNATGYFSNPFVPEIPGARESSIPQRHTANYQDAEALGTLLGKSDPLVLIVGKRLSAGQTMVELVDAGFSVALSHRSAIQFGSGPIGWWIFFRMHPWLEARKLKRQGLAARAFETRMPGGRTRKLIESGAVRTFPEIARFEGRTVGFNNGERLQPDAVIYATGFRPALGHLTSLDLVLDGQSSRPQLDELESVSAPGLFFIGLDHGRNFQSRFLRGIRNDAVVLAERLEQRLRIPAQQGAGARMALSARPSPLDRFARTSCPRPARSL